MSADSNPFLDADWFHTTSEISGTVSPAQTGYLVEAEAASHKSSERDDESIDTNSATCKTAQR